MKDAILFWLNPIFRRELLDRLRSWKTLAAISSVAIVSCGLVMLRWPTDSTVDIVSQGAVLIFRPLAFAVTLAVMMLVPAFPATSLVSERKKGTLAILLNSPMTPVQIYLGKLASNVTLGAILMSASLPAFAACVAMGGVSIRDHLGPMILVFLAMSLQYTAVGLWISQRSQSTDASLRWTYIAVLLLVLFSIAPMVFVGKLAGPKAFVAQALTAVSPASALQQITSSQGAAAVLGIQTGWGAFLLASVLITILLAVMTLRSLDPVKLDRARPTGKIIARDANKAGVLRSVNYIVDPNKRKSGIPRWLNPIMVKEFRTRKFGRLHWLIRLIFICAIVSLGLTVVAATGTVSWGVARIASSMVLMQLGLLLLVGPSLGANLFASELESRGWPILRTSPISPLRIVSGKLMSVVWTLLLVLLASLPGYAVMSYIQPDLSGQVSNVMISMLVAIALVVCISACVSTFAKSTAAATAMSYGVLLTLFAGTLLVWLAQGRPFGALFVERVLMFNPAAAALSEMKAPGFEAYRLAPMCWWIGLGISAACAILMSIRVWKMTRPD